jgi:hypothetical protein
MLKNIVRRTLNFMLFTYFKREFKPITLLLVALAATNSKLTKEQMEHKYFIMTTQYGNPLLVFLFTEVLW